MQADEIIQQKEWGELTMEEKGIVYELAETEQEYNLLKKMLQVSAEEADDVPVIGDHVKEELRLTVAAKKTSYTRYWYAAAAAIILFIAGSVFLKKDKPADQTFVKKDTIINSAAPVIAKTIITPPTDSIAIVPVHKAEVAKSAANKILPSIKPQNIPQDNITNTPVYAAITKTVSDEKELLDLVTEIY